jgi:hypothetical protein
MTASHTLAHDGALSRRNPLRRYAPKRPTAHSRWRFFRSHRASLIERIGGGQPTERQALAIDMLLRAEWAVVVAEHDAALAPDARTRTDAMRVAGDSRKQVLLWDRALTAAAPPPAPPERPMDALEYLRLKDAARAAEAAA